MNLQNRFGHNVINNNTVISSFQENLLKYDNETPEVKSGAFRVMFEVIRCFVFSIKDFQWVSVNLKNLVPSFLLSETEKGIISEDLNFAIGIKWLPREEIVSAIKLLVRIILELVIEGIRFEVVKTHRNAKPFCSNLQGLQINSEVANLPGDKRNASDVLGLKDYVTISRDSTLKVERHVTYQNLLNPNRHQEKSYITFLVFMNYAFYQS